MTKYVASVPWSYRPNCGDTDKNEIDSTIMKKDELQFYHEDPRGPLAENNRNGNVGGTENDLEVLAKPLQTYMRIAGLSYYESSDPGHGGHGYSIQKLYCIFTVTVNWLLLFSYIVFSVMIVPVVLETLNFKELPNMACIFMWHFQNAINATILYKLSANGQFRETFLRRWDSFHPSDTVRSESMAQSRKMRNFLMAVCLTINISNSLGLFGATFNLIPGSSEFKLYPVELLYGHDVSIVVHRVWGVTAAFTTPSWTLLLGLFCYTTSVCSALYDSYNAQLKRNVQALTTSMNAAVENVTCLAGKFPHDIEDYRQQYEKINQMVECADENFSVFLLTAILSNLIMMCSRVYHNIYFCSRGIMKVNDVIWSAGAIGNLVMMCAFGTQLNESAHGALSSVHAIPRNNLPLKLLQQISMFSSRLKGPLIGVTGWGFFLLSKDFILSLISTFFTYFIILIEMGNANKNSSDCT